MKPSDEFPFPLDKDIVEQVPIQKVSVDFDEQGRPKTSVRTVMEKQTVRYMNVPKSKVRCKDGEHVFRVLNMRKYLFACTKCPFVRKVYPATYRFEQATGRLINRRTGQAI